MGLLMAAAVPMMADVVYDSLPSPTPPNVPSVGFQATATSEFGQGVKLQGDFPVVLNSATLLMSNWALESAYEPVGTSAGFHVPLTLDLYQVGAGDTVGPQIGTGTTIDALIQWRPEASAGCGTAWRAPDGQCYNGLAQTVTFNMVGITVPNQFIWGLAFNTTSYGANPTGVLGPYDSLNIGLNSNPDGVHAFTPSVGSDLIAGSVYWNTSHAGFYTDGGAGGVGTFRQDTQWEPYDPAIQFNGTVTPEPSFFLLVGLGFAGLFVVRYKFRGKTA
ncbi:MAG: hypothetical protein LAN36_16225 [Acidobacteriia bacterium]|nr:hypothetical protein [Terriglobia bacterium]